MVMRLSHQFSRMNKMVNRKGLSQKWYCFTYERRENVSIWMDGGKNFRDITG